MAEEQEAGTLRSALTGTTGAECERMVERALLRDPTVKFMVEKLEEVHPQSVARPVLLFALFNLHLASLLSGFCCTGAGRL